MGIGLGLTRLEVGVCEVVLHRLTQGHLAAEARLEHAVVDEQEVRVVALEQVLLVEFYERGRARAIASVP